MKRFILTQTNLYRNGILNKLCANGYNLSTSELVLCAFIFDEFKSNEIAENLNISKRTIDNHKLHLRKKFNLSKLDNIEVFLKQI